MMQLVSCVGGEIEKSRVEETLYRKDVKPWEMMALVSERRGTERERPGGEGGSEQTGEKF